MRVVNPGPRPLKFNVTAFVAGKNLLIFYIQQQGGTGVSRPCPGKITKVSGKVFGQKITISIPANLQQPAPGLYSTLIHLKSTLGSRRARTRSSRSSAARTRSTSSA